MRKGWRKASSLENGLDGKALTEKQRLGNVPMKEPLMEGILSLA